MSNIKRPIDAELELKFLGGLIKNGENLWVEVSQHIDEKCFTKKENLNLFRICKTLLDEQSSLDTAIITSRCKSLGWKISPSDTADFIDNLLLAPLNMDGSLTAAREIKMKSLQREAIDKLRETALKVSEYSNTNLIEFNNLIEEGISNVVQVETEENQMVNLGKMAYDMAELAGTEGPEYYIKTPWPTFDRAFDGFYPKEAYGFAGRPTHGKSGLMLGLAEQCATRIKENWIDGKPLEVLYLDTEMEEKQQAYRLAACVSDVNPNLIKSGKWRNNKETFESIRGALAERAELDNFTFKYIPGMTAMQVRSLFRKWLRKKVGSHKTGIVVFDYLKISGNELANTDNTSLALAHKLDILKDEIKKNSNCILLFGCQRNRHGDDDDTSIAESDHIQRLASSLFIVKKKSIEEKLDEPEDKFGTHKLIPIKLRELGEDGANFERPVKIKKIYYPNWINLSWDNFNFADRGDGRAVQDYLSLNASANRQSGGGGNIP